MAEWETSQLSSSSSDTESQEERDVHTPRTPIQNVNLSYSSTSSNASPVQTPKTTDFEKKEEEEEEEGKKGGGGEECEKGQNHDRKGGSDCKRTSTE